jgi:hypothetical protein
MIFDPTSLPFAALFTDPHMFGSRRAWRRSGFEVLDPAKDSECMVAAHAAAPGCLFKKYADDVSPKEQRANYQARIEGAIALARFITAERLVHIVVPRKHLHELPASFRSGDRPAYVLVVERMDIVGRRESEARFKNIAEPVLRELLRVLVHFKGLDSNSKNVQFTRAGQIAFVDLENWGRTDRDRVRLKSIGEYLSKDRYKLAKKILGDLA